MKVIRPDHFGTYDSIQRGSQKTARKRRSPVPAILVTDYLLILLLAAGGARARAANPQDGLRATLTNGLRVVIVRNTLAPVVTTVMNYKVGSDQAPEGFPGMAHAQEHMMFRGCSGLSADQTSAIFAQLGGNNNADTQQDITQYFETVPAHDLDVALHVDSACMKGAADSDQQWALERGAIEQEVSRDLSDPAYKMIVRMNHDLFAGTPYEHDPLGTRPSFDATTGAMLKSFHAKWYAPNNATLVITGDGQPAAAMAEIRRLYSTIPRRRLPARAAIKLGPVQAESFTLPSDLPYILTAVAFRMPGTDSIADYAAAQVLADVLASQRGAIYGLVPAGKALDAGFQLAETYHKASMGMAYVVLPAKADAAAMTATLRKTIAGEVAKGLSAELVEAAKRREIAQAEFNRNSIPGLGQLWSEALVAEGRSSPQQDVDAIRKVTVDDVNRIARQCLMDAQAIAGTLQPQPSAAPVAGEGFGGSEKVTSAPRKPVQLPAWARSELGTLAVPKWNLSPSDTTLPNGIRLIVQTDRETPTITLIGHVREQPDLEAAKGQDGVNRVLDGLFPYGTTTLDRLAFQKALDDIAADESAGSGFSLQVLSDHLDRGVDLLADNLLHPALPAKAFEVLRRQTASALVGELQSPRYLARRALHEGLYPKGDPVLRQATPPIVSHLSLADVKGYYHQVFRPDMTTIVMVGDVTPERAKAIISKAFGAWSAAGPKPVTDLPPVPLNKPSAAAVPDQSRVQDEVTLAETLGLTRSHPDYYTLQVGEHILAGAFYATRLYHDLREETGLVYTVDAMIHAGKTRSTLGVFYACDPKNVSRARTLIERDLRQMQTTPVTPEELRQAKTLLLRQILLNRASVGDIGGQLLALTQEDLPLDEPLRAARRYRTITAAQVKAAFARWPHPADLVQVVVGPSPR